MLKLEIGERYGPFDLALIPIWRGASLSFLGPLGLRVSWSLFFLLASLSLLSLLLHSTVHPRNGRIQGRHCVVH
jgi:hypothetical protein